MIILIGLTEIILKIAIIDSKRFNYKNKISEFKYINIKDLVNNIRNNKISEMSAKKNLNTLNEIKNSEIIKHKKYTPGQKELLTLFKDLLDTILTDKTLMSSNEDNENENGKTLMSSKHENKNAKNRKASTNTKKDENENMLLEYMKDVDDKLFTKYSLSKNFNSFINEFDHATNK